MSWIRSFQFNFNQTWVLQWQKLQFFFLFSSCVVPISDTNGSINFHSSYWEHPLWEGYELCVCVWESERERERERDMWQCVCWTEIGLGSYSSTVSYYGNMSHPPTHPPTSNPLLCHYTPTLPLPHTLTHVGEDWGKRNTHTLCLTHTHTITITLLKIEKWNK